MLYVQLLKMSRIDCIVHFARRKTLQIGSYLHPLLMYQAKLPSGNLDGENSQNIFPLLRSCYVVWG